MISDASVMPSTAVVPDLGVGTPPRGHEINLRGHMVINKLKRKKWDKTEQNIIFLYLF